MRAKKPKSVKHEPPGPDLPKKEMRDDVIENKRTNSFAVFDPVGGSISCL